VMVTTGAISRAKLQSNHHRQQSNFQLFNKAGCPSCHPTNSVKALKGNITFHELAYPKLTCGLLTLSLIIDLGFESQSQSSLLADNKNQLSNIRRRQNKQIQNYTQIVAGEFC